MIISLPLPDPRLSPNARQHWRPRAVVIRAHKEHAFWCATNAMREQGFTQRSWATKRSQLQPLNVLVTVHYPDHRRRDLDNTVSACKGYQDGIATALGVDDAKWNVSYRKGEIIKGGRVTYEVLP